MGCISLSFRPGSTRIAFQRVAPDVTTVRVAAPSCVLSQSDTEVSLSAEVPEIRFRGHVPAVHLNARQMPETRLAGNRPYLCLTSARQRPSARLRSTLPKTVLEGGTPAAVKLGHGTVTARLNRVTQTELFFGAVCPEDLVTCCFGAGYWRNDIRWRSDIAWRNE